MGKPTMINYDGSVCHSGIRRKQKKPKFLEKPMSLNHSPLTNGEVMTIRVALNHFVTDLEENGLGEDEVGKEITKGYLNNAYKLIRLLSKN